MDWGATNQSPQQDWIDRRKPDMVFQDGVLNRRSPAPSSTSTGDRPTGMAYEHMISLANATGKDPWICIPHLATDDYVTKLAQLICYGSDGINPYTSPQANPVWPPLDPSLKVWLEYSNEIWSSGGSFPQGNWAEAQAIAAGYGGGNGGKAMFNARRCSQVWSLFQQVFGGSQRIVRVGAIFTASSSYTTPFLTELKKFGPTLSPAVEPDVISPTTYFGNGIQDWAYEQSNLNRAQSANKTWFHTAGDFVINTTTGATRPVSKPLTDPYWTSPKLAADLDATFEEWKKRIFSGSTAAGGGPDSTGVNGGFDAALAQTIFSTFGKRLPLISYEGGPSLYVDYYDGGDARDDGITNFAVILNRQQAMSEIYRIQLNMSRAKGLDAHGLFVDIARPGKYGQWGHLEYLGQPHQESPKWNAVIDWGEDMLTIRNPLFPVGTTPTFTTAGILPQGAFLQPYSTDIVASGSGLVWSVIGSLLAPGLTIAPVPGDPTRYRLSGSPGRGGWSYLYLRVNDSDGDAAWQVFSMDVPGGPGTLLESRLVGPTSTASLPYTTTQALDSTLINWSGIHRLAPDASGGGSALLPGATNYPDGTGVTIHTATDCLRYSVSQGTDTQASSTLQSAITDNEGFTFTITPKPGQTLDLRNAEFQFTWNREEYHTVRNIAVFSSIGGFSAGQQIFTTANTPGEDAITTTIFRLPETPAYAGLTTPVEFRLYLHGSQYGHKGQFHGLKLTRDLKRTRRKPKAWGE
jgi:hypothetical protein